MSGPLRESVERGLVRALAGLPPRAQRVLAGRPVEIDGQRLEPEVQLSLRLLAVSPHPDFETLPVDEARRQVEEEARMFAGAPIPVAEVRALEAAGLPARLYVPPVPTGALLVYLHGGGWVVGSLDTHDQTCRFLARESGVRVLSVGYRLAPEWPFPNAVEDALAAFAWAVENAASLGGHPQRVAVGGDSAGGNLSAVVAQRAERRPAMQLLVYPVGDLSAKRPSYALFREGFFLTERQMDWYRGHYLPTEDAARDPRASPLLADDLSGGPPAYVAAAGFDPLRDEVLEYARRLDEAGVDVTVAFHEGLVHGFANAVAVGRTGAAAMRGAAAALARV